jgi:beta-1,4-mannosyltransferase
MRLRMLATSSQNRIGANPFPSLWTEAVQSSGVEVTAYSRKAALLHRFDILHIHWPEVLVNVSAPSLRAGLRTVFNLCVILWMKIRGTKVVWTVHNIHPHDTSDNRYNRLALRAFRALVDEFWALSSSSEHLLRSSVRSTVRIRLIPHPSYPLHLENIPQPTPGKILSFGEVRPYKGYIELCEEFGRTAPDSAMLTIIGAGRSDTYSAALRAAVDKSYNVEWLDARLSDAELEREVAESEVVILHYNKVTNSGSALLALSLNRPIIVPPFATFVELADEVGPGWVNYYSGDLTADISAALQPKETTPDLSKRSWKNLGAEVHQSCMELCEEEPVRPHSRPRHGRGHA